MRKQLFAIFILLLITSAVFFMYIMKYLISTSNGVGQQQEEQAFINFEKLNDKIEGQNIFFIDSTRMKKRMKERPFKARQACAVESAALMHPDKNVFVLFVSKYGETSIKRTPLLSSILTYPNVYFKLLDLQEFSKETPLEDFIQSEKLQNAKFVVTHTSDAMRLLTLWKYGGTYLDTDVIVTKRLDSVPANFVCDDICDVMNGAVINLDKTNDGQRLSLILLEDLVKNYNGQNWGSNGPLLITRVLQKLCQTNKTEEMILKGNCEGFHLLPSRFCYPITGVHWFKFFEEAYVDFAMNAVVDSIVVHFWNNLSKKRELRTNSTAAYIQLAKRFCPKVFETCGEFF